jgi:hypothetical protein
MSVVLDKTADAILAAGYRKPRTITTTDDLAALPVYSVVLDADAIAYQHYGSWDPNNETRIQWSAEGRWFDTEQIALPATVLHEPEATK